MIARITRAKSGISDYLETGIRNDSEYVRSEKDNVITIYGNLETLRQAEKYLNKKKNYKDNYIHITISYSKEDMQRMANMTQAKKMAMKRDIVMTYIKHHTSGYDIDNEVIAYAETHQPKIKYEHDKERLEHEHIIITLYNPLNDTKLQTTFHNNSFIDDTLQAYINKKYRLSQPRQHKREREGINAQTNIAKDRKYYKEALKDIKSNSELIQYFKDNNIQYREVKTKSNHYYKIINTKGTDINLKGRGFEHIHKITIDKDFVYNENKDIKELEKVLSSYYKQRIEQIDKRRSKTTKEAIQKIYKTQTEAKTNEYSLQTASYQQKIFYKHYKHLINDDLKGYYIDTQKQDNTKFINKSKNINIEDNGDRIISHTNDKQHLQERVRLILNIAEAKKWNINNLEVKGSKEFISEVEKQIADRIRLKEQIKKQKDKNLSYTTIEAVKKEIDNRPTTATQTYKRQAIEKQEQIKANNDISLTMLKQNLQAQNVLDYAVAKYKLNRDDYTITEDNKINNINNKQKPKNVIDFLQKEVNIKITEAIEISRELYKTQPLNIKSQQQQEEQQSQEQPKQQKQAQKREVKIMPMNLSICKDTNVNALNKWEQVEITNYNQLVSYMKQFPYSQAIYDNGYRNSDNVKSFNNVLIYDIDNDKDTPQLTINQAKELLKQHNISAMLLPSRSNNTNKNGHIAERYRIVIPIKQSIDIQDKATFREFQRITARALKIDKYVDKKALNDKARYYYKSPISAEPIIIKANRVMNIDNLQARAIKNIAERQATRDKEQQRVNEIRANLSQYKTVNNEPSNNLTYANIEKIMQLDIKQLINYFDKDAKSYKDGSYDMIKTADAKYSIIDNNIAHDFKSDKTYNSLTYLQYALNETNINRIARELEKITSDSYMNINYQKVKDVVQEARRKARNDKTFENVIKERFKVQYAKLDKDSIQIADTIIKLTDIDIDKHDIIEDLRNNRKEYEEEQKQQQEEQNKRIKLNIQFDDSKTDQTRRKSRGIKR